MDKNKKSEKHDQPLKSAQPQQPGSQVPEKKPDDAALREADFKRREEEQTGAAPGEVKSS